MRQDKENDCRGVPQSTMATVKVKREERNQRRRDWGRRRESGREKPPLCDGGDVRMGDE